MAKKPKAKSKRPAPLDTSQDVKGFIRLDPAANLREVLNDPFNYTLHQGPDGRYELEIIANNGPAYYIYVHRLTDRETALYKKRGKKYIGALANKYRNS